MTAKLKIARIAMAVLGMSLTIPVASTLLAQPDAQNGYMVAWSIGGFIFCPDGTADECK